MSLLEETYYESFVCTIRYLTDDQGQVDATNAFRHTTCGTTQLSSIDKDWRNYKTFLEDNQSCNAEYKVEYEKSYTETVSLPNGEEEGTVECAFSRDVLVPNLFAIRAG